MGGGGGGGGGVVAAAALSTAADCAQYRASKGTVMVALSHALGPLSAFGLFSAGPCVCRPAVKVRSSVLRCDSH